VLKNYKKFNFVVVLVCLGLVFSFYFFNLGSVKASPGTVEFTDDVILDLTGLYTTTYIASGSECDSLAISATDLTVNIVDNNVPFLLKTATHKVLEVTPSGGTADFTFSSANVSSNGYINEWKETSSIDVTHKVGVPTADDYTVKVDGVVVGEFSGPEISFTRAGTGVEETYTIESPPCVYHNIWGYAWSENIGWISFSCRNTMAEGTGNDYGVDVDPATGLFSGYAWSENIGWISFESADLSGCPSGTCEANLNLITSEVSGWAKALVAADGWDGWIGLSGTWANGVSLNSASSPSEFEGWAWGDVVVGWISFNCNNPETGNVCGVSDYKVMTDLNFPPYIEPGSALIQYEEYCDFSPIGRVGFEWIYQDDDGDDQDEYNLQVATDAGFSNLVVDAVVNQIVLPSSKGTSAVNVKQSPTAQIDDLDIGYGDSYFWQIRVKAATGNLNWSGWESGPSFSTPSNPYPNPSFTWDPISPPAEVEVTFTDNSICYTGAANCKDDAGTSYAWDFDNDSVIDDTTKGDTVYTYPETGDYIVELGITDTIDGVPRTCYQEEELTATLPLPEWKEIAPF